MTPRPGALALALIAAGLALSACGKQAELERPKPMFGRAATQPNAGVLSRREAQARARAEAAKVADPQAPQSVDEVRSPGAKPPQAEPGAPPGSGQADTSPGQ